MKTITYYGVALVGNRIAEVLVTKEPSQKHTQQFTGRFFQTQREAMQSIKEKNGN